MVGVVDVRRVHVYVYVFRAVVQCSAVFASVHYDSATMTCTIRAYELLSRPPSLLSVCVCVSCAPSPLPRGTLCLFVLFCFVWTCMVCSRAACIGFVCVCSRALLMLIMNMGETGMNALKFEISK